MKRQIKEMPVLNQFHFATDVGNRGCDTSRMQYYMNEFRQCEVV